MEKPSVLFLCTGNSIRSQMAEAYLHLFGRGAVEVFSAGISPAGIHPLTKTTLAEDGINIDGQRSKSLHDLPHSSFDYVITLCDHARNCCSPFPKTTRHLHWSIEDPGRYVSSEDVLVQKFRDVRDDLKDRIRRFADEIIRS